MSKVLLSISTDDDDSGTWKSSILVGAGCVDLLAQDLDLFSR